MLGKIHQQIYTCRRANLRQYISTKYKSVAENNNPDSLFLFGNLPDEIEIIDKRNKVGALLATGKVPAPTQENLPKHFPFKENTQQGNFGSSGKAPQRKSLGSNNNYNTHQHPNPKPLGHQDQSQDKLYKQDTNKQQNSNYQRYQSNNNRYQQKKKY